MRIRKNRKLSSFMPAEIIQAYDCQLNQSPWDIISFEEIETDKSSPQHFDRENNSKEDRTFGNFINGIVGSDTSLIQKRDKLVINVEDICSKNRDNNMDSQIGLEKGAKILRCVKNDGKGWQCINEPNQGFDLCDHHLDCLQSSRVRTNTQPNDHPLIKSSEKMKITATTTSARRQRSRAAKKGSTSTSNPYEFYYYAGFGSFWGKKRGEIEDMEVNCTQIDKEKVICINRDEADGNEKNNDNENENSCKKRKKPAKASIDNARGP